MTHAHMRRILAIGGGSKDYVSNSVLGILMREGKLERSASSKKHIARVE